MMAYQITEKLVKSGTAPSRFSASCYLNPNISFGAIVMNKRNSEISPNIDPEEHSQSAGTSIERNTHEKGLDFSQRHHSYVVGRYGYGPTH
jgi:hypothetical protein